MSSLNFFNSPRCCCGAVDVLLGVRIIAGLSILGQATGIPVAWSKQTTGVAAADTVYALIHILFAVMVFVGVAKQKAQHLVPFTILSGLNVAGFALFTLFSFFVVPFLKPLEGHEDLSMVELGMAMGMMGLVMGAFALWFFAIALSAFRVLNGNSTYDSGFANENYA